jgi:hypothetical protein
MFHLVDGLHLALLLVVMTLANPRAWRCDFVALLFPCLMLAQRVWQRRPGSRIAFTALGMVILRAAYAWYGRARLGPVPMALGKHFWGGVAIAGACW